TLRSRSRPRVLGDLRPPGSARDRLRSQARGGTASPGRLRAGRDAPLRAPRINWGGTTLPLDLDRPCGRHFRLRDLVHCGETCQRMIAAGKPVDNVPRQPETLRAMQMLCQRLLDPVVD